MRSGVHTNFVCSIDYLLMHDSGELAHTHCFEQVNLTPSTLGSSAFVFICFCKVDFGDDKYSRIVVSAR